MALFLEDAMFVSLADLRASMGDIVGSINYDTALISVLEAVNHGDFVGAKRQLDMIQAQFNPDVQNGRLSPDDQAAFATKVQKINALMGTQYSVTTADQRQQSYQGQVTQIQRDVTDQNKTAGQDSSYEQCMAKLRQGHGAFVSELLGPSACGYASGGGAYDSGNYGSKFPGSGSSGGNYLKCLLDGGDPVSCMPWWVWAGAGVAAVGVVGLYAAPFLIGRYRAIKKATS